MNMQYEQGGAVKQAQGLAALGRGEDTQLIHMTPSEIKGLNTLAQGFGGGLTVNPDTGLPEAGFLKNILPMLVGGGLAIATGGLSSAFINPFTIGGAMGLGGLAASGGDLNQALKWGLGGYGGAGIAQSVSGALAANPGTMGSEAVAATQGTTGQAVPGVTEALTQGTGGVAGANPFGETTFNYLGDNAAAAATNTPASLAKLNAKFLTELPTQNFPALTNPILRSGNASAMAGTALKEGIAATAPTYGTPFMPAIPASGMGATGNLFTKAGFETLKADPSLKYKLGAGAVGMAAGYEPPKQGEIKQEKDFFPEGGYKTNKQAMSVSAPVRDTSGNIIPRMGEATYFSPNEGGITQVNPNARNYYGPEGTESNFYGGGVYGTDSSAAYTPPPPVKGPFGIMMDFSKNSDAEKYNYPVGGYQYAAQGGLMGFADGGLTRGPGDGMSDDIMTSISGQQAAALSPGEFVVPADVVSDMGNGDTSAGAKQLYSMMDRVRKARGGSIEQPGAINPNEYMPA
jgi:hypothetical protein